MINKPQKRSSYAEKEWNGSGKPAKVKTIAYLSSSPGGRFNLEKWLMWRGIAEAAKDFGFNLIYLAGEEFEKAPQAVLYDLIGKHNVEGVIVWQTFVSQHCTIEAAQKFVQSFDPLPVVSVDLPLEGCANLLMDDAKGVKDLLNHLVNVHGYRRIAFTWRESNQAAGERQKVFEQAMSYYGLLEPRLVGSLDELTQRGVFENKECEAVMAFSDDLAVEVIDLLMNLGLRVPEDIVVTGFNDGQEARGALPPLTTIRLPFRNLGRKAVELLNQKIEGDPSVPNLLLEPHLILRRSCGCLEPMAEQAAAGPFSRTSGILRDKLTSARETLPTLMTMKMGTSIESLANSWADELFDIFVVEMERHLDKPYIRTPSNQYLYNMSELLRAAVSEGSNVTRWHEALSILRQVLLPYLDGDNLAFAEDLWQQARVLIGQVAVRAEVHRNWQAARRMEILREVEAELLIALEFEELLDILDKGLTRLEIDDFYLVLYESALDPAGMGRLVLAHHNGQRAALDMDEQRFAVRSLLPSRWMVHAELTCLVVEALHLREEQIGYIVFRAGPPSDALECDVYQALRIQLSSALKGICLRQKLQDARQQAEEANQLKSRFLSMVSHELRTPLNLIVGLSEMALRQHERDKAEDNHVLDVLRKFLEQIYVSGQHLDRLIRDVLDLASSQVGQMNLILDSLDLVPVLRDVASMGEHLAQQKNLYFRIEIPETLPRVMGDKTRLRQILLNLLSNAVKFTAHGEVALTAVLEGEEILISVSDTGLGIEKEDQDHIFDEFRQSDRSVARGYGGIGLGLAITRRLVEMHGGRIWVSSSGDEGSGSTFQFTLPVIATCSESEFEPLPVLDEEQRGVVLIITKEPERSSSLLSHLTQHQFQVEEMVLQEADEIFNRLQTAPPGAVVLDLAPASELGWEIMKKVKENPATQDIPVLFYSLITEENSGTMLEMDFLTKPVGTNDLLKALERHGLTGHSPERTRTILVIDDEPGIVDLHARILRTELPNCNVLTAQSGQEGLHIMRHTIPQLVMLDLMMPELDGFGVLKAMQNEEMLRNIPVIILSGQSLSSREMEMLNHGVATVLSKGVFTTKEILNRVEDVLARNKRLGSEAQRLVQQAMAYIHEHYKEPLSRSDIANHLCINEQYLSRCFNKEAGLGPMVYLSRYRIQRACRLLEAGNLSVTQVAMEVGMSSQSYFSRVFQDETGVTPSAYQRGVRPPNR